jgi:formylglycine-generating enzyme required for sulfatase activity
MVMVYVPAGEFTMGSNEYDNEKPVHPVTLDAFWIDRTEVTNAQYQKCVAASACAASEYTGDSKYNGSQQPVVGVGWNDADGYCHWAGARLPTEAEWEKAARGTDGRIYPWGNETPACRKANYLGCKGGTSQVGSYPSGASPYGALDMAGNVCEWVNDWYDGGYYSHSPANDPKGPDSGDHRVLRGGSWNHGEFGVRAAYRGSGDPTLRGYVVGFRCVVAGPGG